MNYRNAPPTRHRASVLVDATCLELRDELLSAFRPHAPFSVDLADDLGTDWFRADHADVAFVGLAHPWILSTIPIIRALRQCAPGLEIHVCAVSRPHALARIHEVAWAGADAFHTLSCDADFRALPGLVRQRCLAPAPRTTLAALAQLGVPEPTLALALHCVRNALHDWSQQKVSWFFGRTVQGLNANLRRHQLLSLGLFTRAGVLAHGELLRERGIQCTSEVAARLNLPAAKLLCDRTRRFRRDLEIEMDRSPAVARILADALPSCASRSGSRRVS